MTRDFIYLIVRLNSAHCSDYIKRHFTLFPNPNNRGSAGRHRVSIRYSNYISLRPKVEEEGEFSKRICPSKTGDGLAYR